MSPQSSWVQVGPQVWGAAGTPEGCRGARGLLGTPAHVGMHVPARANGSSSLAATVLHNWTSHGASPQEMDTSGYREVAGGRVQPGAFCTIS